MKPGTIVAAEWNEEYGTFGLYGVCPEEGHFPGKVIQMTPGIEYTPDGKRYSMGYGDGSGTRSHWCTIGDVELCNLTKAEMEAAILKAKLPTCADYLPLRSDNDQHVIPETGRKHAASPDCWCEPRSDQGGSPAVWIHNYREVV